MAGLLSSAKELLSVKIKFRHDSKFDQYSRIGMVKFLMLSASVVALNWFSDKITCIVPGSVKLSDGFVSEACWIQGFFIYPQAEASDLAYYGVPEDMDMDGRYSNGKMCKVSDTDKLCEPLEKTFYLQFQYMPFFLAALCVFYYVPYMVLSTINKDLISLHDTLKSGTSPEAVTKTYFKKTSNKKVRALLLVTIVVKVLYVIANILGMVMCDLIFYGKFMAFGTRYANWSALGHEEAYDYTGMREAPKPSNMLLPTFGICEVQESARDARHTIINRHKFVCEFSQHILYHYVLIMLWYAFVMGVVLSILGLIWKVIEYMSNLMRSAASGMSHLNIREIEYLDAIQRKDTVLYGQVHNILKEED